MGHWEGDTLVVDTTNQNTKTWFDTSGNFKTEALHVTEKFIPQDANTIVYEVTVTDPDIYTQPWTAHWNIGRNRNEKMSDGHPYEQMEFGCIEGNTDLQHYTEDKGGKAPKKRSRPDGAEGDRVIDRRKFIGAQCWRRVDRAGRSARYSRQSSTAAERCHSNSRELHRRWPVGRYSGAGPQGSDPALCSTGSGACWGDRKVKPSALRFPRSRRSSGPHKHRCSGEKNAPIF